MPFINLISESRQKRAQLIRNRKRLLTVLLVEVAVLAGLFSFLSMKSMLLGVRLTRAQREIVRLQPTLDLIAQTEQETRQLMPKLRTLTDAQEHTRKWFVTLNGIARCLPVDVWLTGLSSAQAQSSDSNAKTTTITLTGSTLTQQQVGEMMLRLNTIPTFEKVQLHFTQQRSYNDMETVDFEVAAQMRAPKEQEDSDEKNTS